MSLSSQLLEIRGSVDFESKWNLQITGHVLSDLLFGGIPFSDEVPGLREEVPAAALTKQVFGLCAILHGCCEGDHYHFSLDCTAGEQMFERLISDHDGGTLDFGKWLAQMIGTVPELRVTGHSPY